MKDRLIQLIVDEANREGEGEKRTCKENGQYDYNNERRQREQQSCAEGRTHPSRRSARYHGSLAEAD